MRKDLMAIENIYFRIEENMYNDHDFVLPTLVIYKYINKYGDYLKRLYDCN